ncbi:hypothetical protein M427DRAFT_135252 [Gonapodya prolifera JEL478]|uniref:Uncharacterized protein n=1 Tax=Gonapodya prolifera (strain JEL478) TaxID=1344416 RepID=A0A139AEX1_GONPJ|nr:hypothetical protein M427DRAFT_135252 [Gonapodya prolifera JEL478]|eukprot:KXS15300.1 hypothetical protein M427DRAFT_135252 [Gonapodya prolifera JEL478]
MSTLDTIEPRFLPVLSFSVPAAAIASALYFLSVPFIVYTLIKTKPGPNRSIDTRNPNVNLAFDFGIGRGVAFLIRAILVNHFSTTLLTVGGIPFTAAMPGLCIQLAVRTRLWALKAIALGVELVPGRTIKRQVVIVNVVFLVSLAILLGCGLPLIIVGSLYVVNNPPGHPQHDAGVRYRLITEAICVVSVLCTLVVAWTSLQRVKRFDVARLRRPVHVVTKSNESNGSVDKDTSSTLEAATSSAQIPPFETVRVLMEGLTRLIIPCSLLVLARLIAGLCFLPLDTFIGIYPNEAVWYPFVVIPELLFLITLNLPRSYAFLNLPWPPLEDDVVETGKENGVVGGVDADRSS